MKPRTLQQIVEGRLYNTETAILLAGNDWWDGNNYERSGRQTFLYRTPRGRFFFTHLSCWQGESDSIEPCTPEEAAEFFSLPQAVKRVPFEAAFPNLHIEEA